MINNKPYKIDLAGKVFGRLTVLSYGGKLGNTTAWICECSCKNKTVKLIRGCHLKNGTTKSCGCIIIEQASQRNLSHGLTDSKEYHIWQGLRSRCQNINNKDYIDYGGRGIKVCSRWNESFVNFLEDMGKCPDDKDSIDRLDNNSNYEKDNCRWATNKEQHNNKRSNRLVKYNGKTQNIKQWSKEFGIREGLISYRLNKGMTAEECFETPVATHEIKFEINGETLNMTQLAQRYNMSVTTLSKRLKNGFTLEEAINTPLRGKNER